MLSEIDWHTYRQRHQFFSMEYVKNGHEVFYVNHVGMRIVPKIQLWFHATRKVFASFFEPKGGKFERNIRIINTIFIPGKGPFRSLLNRWFFIPRLESRTVSRHRRVILHVYQPTPHVLQIISYFKNAVVLYDCVHDWEKHRTYVKCMRQAERMLIDQADVVITDSDVTYEKHKPKKSAVILVPPGVDGERFSQAYRGDELERLRSFLYYGSGMSVDVDFLNCIAEQTGCKLTLLGIASISPINPKNFSKKVDFIERQPHEKLPQCIRTHDVLLIPYDKECVPAKLLECLATGKPVLANKIHALQRYAGMITMLESGELQNDFQGAVQMLKRRHNSKRNMEYACQASWSSRFDEFYGKLSVADSSSKRNI